MENKFFRKCHSFRVVFLLLIVFILNSFNLLAQKQRVYKIDSLYKQHGMFKIANHIHKNGWVHFNENIKFEPSAFFKTFKNEFGLGSNDQLKLKSQNSFGGMEHYKFTQSYKGIPIEFSCVIVHCQDGNIAKMQGIPELNLNIDITPRISADQAVDLALKFVNAEEYAWEINNNILQIKYPEAELVILPRNDKLKIDKDYLTYKVNVYAIKPLYCSDVYLDAVTGEILYVNNKISYSNSLGTAQTIYSGTVNITADSYNGYYRLHESRIGTSIITYSGDLGNHTEYIDNDNYWTPADPGYDVHWGLEKCFDYYYTKFLRISWDGNGGSMTGFAHFTGPGGTSSMPGYVFLVDAGTDHGPTVAIDNVAHEYTHSVSSSVGLENNGEVGSLNESFSDIFAVLIRLYAYGPPIDWNRGTQSGFPRRSLDHPENIGQPIFYHGTNWCFSDQCDEHINMGVINKWFYLLCTGANNYVNEINKSFTFTGLGQVESETLVYDILINYLPGGSDFLEFCESAFEAAYDLYGPLSQEESTVVNASKAVGLILLDDISCVSSLTLSGDVPNNKMYLVRNTASSGSPGNVVNTNVNSGISFTIWANNIALYPGFKAKSGCDLELTAMNTKYHSKSALMPINELPSALEMNNKTKLKNNNNDVKESFKLFPNPTHDKLLIEGISDFNADIFDLSGRKVLSVNRASESIDLSSLCAGIYTIHLYYGDQTYISKIIKQ